MLFLLCTCNIASSDGSPWHCLIAGEPWLCLPRISCDWHLAPFACTFELLTAGMLSVRLSPVQSLGHFGTVRLLSVLDGLLSKAHHLPCSVTCKGHMLLVASICTLLPQAPVGRHLLTMRCLIHCPQLPAQCQSPLCVAGLLQHCLC